MALRWVVMIEKWRAPSMVRKAISRQLWSTTARLTLQPSSSALATPACSILRLASWVSRWVGMKSGMGVTRSPRQNERWRVGTALARLCPPYTRLSRQPPRARRKKLLDRHRLADDALLQGMADQLLDDLPVGRAAVGQRVPGDLHPPPVQLVHLGRLLDAAGPQALEIDVLAGRERVEHIGGELRMGGEELVLDHHRIIYRVETAPA